MLLLLKLFPLSITFLLFNRISYAAGGFTFGTVTAGAGIPAAIIACNAGLGVCMAACIAAGFAPTP
jgi:hypothetical protein